MSDRASGTDTAPTEPGEIVRPDGGERGSVDAAQVTEWQEGSTPSQSRSPGSVGAGTHTDRQGSAASGAPDGETGPWLVCPHCGTEHVCTVPAPTHSAPPSASGQTQARERTDEQLRAIQWLQNTHDDAPKTSTKRKRAKTLLGLLADLAAAERREEQLREALARIREFAADPDIPVQAAEYEWIANEVDDALADVGGQQSAREEHPGAGGEQP